MTALAIFPLRGAATCRVYTTDLQPGALPPSDQVVRVGNPDGGVLLAAEVTGIAGLPVQIYGPGGAAVETALNPFSTAALNAGRTCYSETTWRRSIDGGVNCVPQYPDGGCVINTSRTIVLVRNTETVGVKAISCGQALQDYPTCADDGPGLILAPGQAFEFKVHDIDQLVCRNCGAGLAATDATGYLCL